jgi:multidrug resistance efflux pump
MIKKSIISILIISLVLLAWCGKKEDLTEDKLSFVIQAITVNELSRIALWEKVWSIMDQQQITVTAQAAWRVSNIPGVEWENVLSGQPIIKLSDTVVSYGIQAERAKNNLDRATAQEAQSRLALEDAIIAAEAWLIQAQESLRVAKAGWSLSMRGQELSAEQARLVSESQLDWIQISFTNESTNLRDILVDAIDRGDSILGVTDKYKRQNENFKILLSAKDSNQRVIAENQLFQLYTILDRVSKLTGDDILWSLGIMIDAYDKLTSYLAQMQQVFINTVTAVNLPEMQLNGFVQTFAWLQSRTQGGRASFNVFRNQAITILSDINGTLAWTIWQESAALGLESTRLNNENAIINAELALANAERIYIQAKNNKEKQTTILGTQIQDAELSYQDAMRQLAKLSVWSPVRGVLWQIFVTLGQEIQPGTPLFSVIGTDRQLLQFTVSEKELPYLRVGKEVLIIHNNDTLSWTIQSVPRVANSSMQYRVVVAADRALSTFGGIVRIQIPVDINRPLLPLKSINGIQSGQGIVHILNADNTIEKMSISLWQTRWSMIELLSDLSQDKKIITNDISSYDANNFDLEIQ